MSALLEEQPKIRTGDQYRFVVRSADEAVRILHERLGERARVVSVRQVEGAGLSRFLRAPKLEVIAEIVSGNETDDLSEKIEVTLPESVETETVVTIEKENASSPVEKAPGDDLARLLTRGGLPPLMLAKIRSAPDWSRIAELPLNMALNEVTLLLRDEYQRRPQLPLAKRVAFIGAAGAGKTTALCKRLANDVFVCRRRAAVLKVDL